MKFIDIKKSEAFTPVKYNQRLSSIKDRNFTGFTLIELLIVIGIIAILAAAVIIAINPGQQFAQARDATRESHINALQNALLSYQVDHHGTLPAEVKDNPGAEICNLQALAEGESCPAGTIDLSPLVPEYISSLPINPSHEPTDPDIGYGIASVENEFTIWPTESETRLVGRRPALEFDGEDDYVDVGTDDENFTGIPELTISAWVNLNENSEYSQTIGGFTDVTSDCNWKFAVSYDRVRLLISNGETQETILSDINLLNNTWYYIAGTYKEGEFLSIYVNEEKKTASPSINLSYKSKNLYIGAFGAGNYSQFNGKIDNVRVYDRALSAQEVEALYNGQDVTNGLVGHWPLNEGQGCTVYDQSGNGNDGTLQPNCPDNNPEWVIGN